MSQIDLFGKSVASGEFDLSSRPDMKTKSNARQKDLSGKKVLTSKEKKEGDKVMTELLGVFGRPIMVWPGYESMGIPDNIQSDITLQRLLLAKGMDNMATETETMWYISTASFIAPLDHDMAEIYMYLCRNFMIRTNREKDLPEFLKKPIILDRYMQEEPLARLRHWIYKKSMDVFKNGRRL